MPHIGIASAKQIYGDFKSNPRHGQELLLLRHWMDPLLKEVNWVSLDILDRDVTTLAGILKGNFGCLVDTLVPGIQDPTQRMICGIGIILRGFGLEHKQKVFCGGSKESQNMDIQIIVSKQGIFWMQVTIFGFLEGMLNDHKVSILGFLIYGKSFLLDSYLERMLHLISLVLEREMVFQMYVVGRESALPKIHVVVVWNMVGKNVHSPFVLV